MHYTIYHTIYYTLYYTARYIIYTVMYLIYFDLKYKSLKNIVHKRIWPITSKLLSLSKICTQLI